MRISDWSSDVCSSDLGIDEDAHLDEIAVAIADLVIVEARIAAADRFEPIVEIEHDFVERQFVRHLRAAADIGEILLDTAAILAQLEGRAEIFVGAIDHRFDPRFGDRSEEHTSELQSLMRISYAVFCLKKKKY